MVTARSCPPWTRTVQQCGSNRTETLQRRQDPLTGHKAVPDGPKQRWPLDFVTDAFNDGQRSRILAFLDYHTHETLALVAETSLSGLRVIRELNYVIFARETGVR